MGRVSVVSAEGEILTRSKRRKRRRGKNTPSKAQQDAHLHDRAMKLLRAKIQENEARKWPAHDLPGWNLSDALDAEDWEQAAASVHRKAPTDRQLRDRLAKSSHGKGRRQGPVKHWMSQDTGTEGAS